MSNAKTTIEYNDSIVRQFTIASIFWALVGLGAGVFIAYQMRFYQLNFDTPWLTFGRLRPLHTNAAIFAFVGNMMFAGIYYSTQRLCKVRLASDLLSKIHFWGWQAIIVGAAITLPLGLTRGKEYAELIWPINICVVLIWVIFAINFFWTLAIRNERTLYVAIWFYIATIVVVAMLYIVNHLQIPTSLVHSYPIFGGVKDALVQWWYGHNAVAFFLTTPILGIMYYYVPKAANRPVYSYRLSVIHFWSLVFVYIWAGPHHLLNTALPGWLQALGMLFSLMLWAPSWGGMLNGLLTLRGAWSTLIKDPVIKFFAAGVTFYGMSTFEGPLLAIKSVNALSHYTDWTIGHVHSGTLGWNGFMAAGMFYWLAPRLWGTKLHSEKLANMHFWLGMIGILIYIAAMWVSGIMQGLMLNAVEDGAMKYAFLETVESVLPLYLLRAIGGTLYLTGFFMLAYNVYKTAKSGKPVNGKVEVLVERKPNNGTSLLGTFINAPTIYSTLGIVFGAGWIFTNGFWTIANFALLVAVVMIAVLHFSVGGAKWIDWYEKLLSNWLSFTVLTLLAAAIGGAIQIIPTVVVQRAENLEGRIQTIYTPLELAGRDIYIEEGCYNCHSQMIRTMVPEVIRYGNADKNNYSHIGESIYNYPFQWGSKRTGPDLAREGGVRNDEWHYLHFMNPRDVSEGSNMPNYAFLADEKFDFSLLGKRIAVQRDWLGVPFDPDMDYQKVALEQAAEISKGLLEAGHYVEPESRMIALIAYIQKLGSYEIVERDLAKTK